MGLRAEQRRQRKKKNSEFGDGTVAVSNLNNKKKIDWKKTLTEASRSVRL